MEDGRPPRKRSGAGRRLAADWPVVYGNDLKRTQARRKCPERGTDGEADLKPIKFIGNTLENIRAFPQAARRKAGQQLQQVQQGGQPDDFKPMPSVGRGVEEIRIKDRTGAFRVIYAARLADAVYVLHAFQKKTQETPRHDIDLAKSRYKAILQGVA